MLFFAVLFIRHRRRRAKQVSKNSDVAEECDVVAEIGLGRQVPGELPEDQRQPPELEDPQKVRQELQGCPGGHELQQMRNSLAESQIDRATGEMEAELGPPYELSANDIEGSHNHTLYQQAQ